MRRSQNPGPGEYDRRSLAGHETVLRVITVGHLAAADRGSFFEVEFVTGDGRTVVVRTLSASDLRAMAAGEIIHARRLARLGGNDPNASAPSRRRM